MIFLFSGLVWGSGGRAEGAEVGRGQGGGGGEGGRRRVTSAGGGVGVAQRRGKARGVPLSDLQ